MLKLMRRFYLLFVGRLWPAKPEPVPEVPAPAPAPAEKKIIEVSSESGEFYFREAILDQLDYYMKCIVRMRRSDAEAFAMYSQVGGQIMPEKALAWYSLVGAYEAAGPDDEFGTTLSPWFRETLPTFGAIFTGKVGRDVERSKKVIIPRFVYFTKYAPHKAPTDVQRVSDGAVYLVTVYWDDPDHEAWDYRPKNGIPTCFPITITPDGEMRLLRCRIPDNNTIRHTKGKDRGRTFTIPRRQWVRADPWFAQWAKEHDASVEDYLVSIFVRVANSFEAANSSVIRVMATRDNLTATFGVDVKRTPYFFKDRNVTLGASGSRKRIFHIVRPHVRKDGAAVRLHFRGEKQFVWNDYQITITVPGRDHIHISEFNVGATDEDKRKHGVKMLGTKELGARLRGWVDGKRIA
jgi:hypothetical protein